MNRLPIRPGTARRLGIHPPVDPALFLMQDCVNLMVWQLDFIAQAYGRPWRPLFPRRPSAAMQRPRYLRILGDAPDGSESKIVEVTRWASP